MKSVVSLPASLLFAAAVGGCAVMPTPENVALKCSDSIKTQHLIPTVTKPFPVNMEFVMACFGDKRGVEILMENHPYGGVGMTMSQTVGKEAPRYEYIPCENNAELKAKWADMEEYSDFANKGRDIQDIRDVQIDMRFREDYRLRHYMLHTAANICKSAPQ